MVPIRLLTGCARAAPALAALLLLPSTVAAQDHQDLLGGRCASSFSGAAAGYSGFAAELGRMSEVTDATPRASRVLVQHSETGTTSWRCFGAEGDRHALRARFEPAGIHVVDNSGYASDRNNGAMWSGRGLSSAVRFGATLAWQGLRLTVAPELVHHENEAFATRSSPTQRDPLAHPLYGTIDWFQRPGDAGDTRVTWGQSSLRFARYGVSAGISTENLWAGPAQRYPIILSNTAEGFPHLFVGTDGALDVWIGRLAARLVWGRTEESDWFDSDASNDWSNLVGWGVSLRPRGLDWLEFGVLRTYKYRARSSLDLNLDPVIDFVTPAEGNRTGDELASLFVRAVLPEHGMEFYGEWARTDRFADVENDLLTEPDHSQGYMIGFQKLTEAGSGAIRLIGELVHLQEKSENRIPGAGRPLNVFYTNGQLRQGHTHQGQLLGAWVGPGADAQYLELGWLSPETGYWAVFGERVRRNEARGIELRRQFPFLHDVELIGGLRAGFVLGETLASASVAYHHERNRLFFEEEATNLRFELELTAY